MRGFIVAVLGAVIILSGSGVAVAAEVKASEDFSDVGIVHAHSINQVVNLGIASGCNEGRFCPAKPISRVEMVVWMYRTAAHIKKMPLPFPADEAVTGLGIADDDWYETYARWAADRGVIASPAELSTRPETVTRAEAAEMLTAAFEHLTTTDEIQGVFADTGDTPEAATRAIEGIHTAGLTRGCAHQPLRYCPHQFITRAQAAAMLARAVQRAEPTVGLIINEPQAARGYTLFTTRVDSDPFSISEVYLMDHLGRKVHTWEIKKHNLKQVKLLENGNLMIRGQPRGPEGGASTKLIEIGPNSNIVWEFTYNNIHHDFLKLASGNTLFLTSDIISPQAAIAIGARPEAIHRNEWRIDSLKEVRPTGPNTGEIVWEWSMLDHLIQDHDPDKPNYGPIAGHPQFVDLNYYLNLNAPNHNPGDFKHLIYLNSIDYNPALGYIMLSVRNYSELWIIDHNITEKGERGGSDLLYRWGNPQTYGAGDYQDQQLFWQHNAQWIRPGLPGAGNVLIFNNGLEFNGLKRNYSSVDEIALPTLRDNTYPLEQTAHFVPAQIQWTYTAPNPNDFYASILSGAQRLPNGNTQITDGTNGTIFQVTPNGTIVWRYDLNIEVYRAPWYPPDYPGLKNLDLTPQDLIHSP